MSSLIARYWECILYPDSTDLEKFLAFVDSHYISYMCSPLHDKDIYDKYDDRFEESETNPKYKKPHRHCILFFPSNRSLKPLARFLGLGENQLAPVGDLHKAVRYLTHEDNPEKASYDRTEVRLTPDVQEVYDHYMASRPKNYKKTGDDDKLFLWDNLIPWLYDNHITHLSDVINYTRTTYGEPRIIKASLSLIKSILEENSRVYRTEESREAADAALQAMHDTWYADKLKSDREVKALKESQTYYGNELTVLRAGAAQVRLDAMHAVEERRRTSSEDIMKARHERQLIYQDYLDIKNRYRDLLAKTDPEALERFDNELPF